MAKKNTTPVFTLIDKVAQLGKIQNNVEDETPEFKLPVELLLQPEELASLLEDKKFVEALFVKSGDTWELSKAAMHLKRMKLESAYDGATVIMTLVDGQDAEFSDCILDTFSFEPLPGGQVALSFNLYVKPGIGKTNLQLQEHQNHEVDLTITNATLALKAKQKQQELALGDPDSTYQGNTAEPPPRGERAAPQIRNKSTAAKETAPAKPTKPAKEAKRAAAETAH